MHYFFIYQLIDWLCRILSGEKAGNVCAICVLQLLARLRDKKLHPLVICAQIMSRQFSRKSLYSCLVSFNMRQRKNRIKLCYTNKITTTNG